MTRLTGGRVVTHADDFNAQLHADENAVKVQLVIRTY